MHKQRIALIIASIVGMSSVFLKWFEGFVLLPDSLFEGAGGLESYPRNEYLLGIELGVGSFIVPAIFLLLFLLVLIMRNKKNPINSIPVIILSVGAAFTTLAIRADKINTNFYSDLSDKLTAARSVAETVQTQEWTALNLIPPASSIGLYLALFASFLALLSLILFPKKKST